MRVASPVADAAPKGRPIVYTFHDPRLPPGTSDVLWQTISGSLILPSDPRYAWYGMFARDYELVPDMDPLTGKQKIVGGVPASVDKFVNRATVYIVPVRCRTKSAYSFDYNDANCDLTVVNKASTNLEPVLCEATLDFISRA